MKVKLTNGEVVNVIEESENYYLYKKYGNTYGVSKKCVVETIYELEDVKNRLYFSACAKCSTILTPDITYVTDDNVVLCSTHYNEYMKDGYKIFI